MINTPTTIEGRWWIEGVDKDPHFGVLNYDPSMGLNLIVKIPQDGGIAEVFGAVANRPSVPSSIFGRNKDNHPVSLYGCIGTNYSFSGGLKSYTVSAMIGLIGLEVPGWDKVSCININAFFSLFHTWMGVSRVSVESGDEMTVRVAKRKTIEVDIDAGTKLVIWPTLNRNQDSSGLVISEGHGVEFRFSEVRPVKDAVHKYVHSFRRFLTLLIGRSIFVDDVYFHSGDGQTPETVILYQINPGVESADRKTLIADMLVSYRDISENLSAVIKRWFELEESLDDVLNLYFATIFVPELHINQTFLFLAQALEVYHRKSSNFQNQVQSKADFRARKKKIVDRVPDEKEWLKEKLAHANEKTLAKRLDELTGQHKEDVAKFIDDTKAFADTIRHTRNHYTHYGTEGKGMEKVAKGIQLMDLSAKMQTLLEICIFADLGISGAPIDRMIQKLKQRQYFQI
jgi:ApeA N-terminal domain 1